ncbi:alpha/beta fold hydrolase [Brevibacterium gallinarum]|uniref:S9 family peptidase n=1 Tax=Brevibacterium gallinarum TaxID=2762220 RepID=A0ABR8WXB9_9MICO|nr:alpha/beta fold hydrolase [Brevibacterium gallinarum]MBD8021724.1 S9 family peptidase [Brevibacterium gallinarum]
MRRWLPEIFGDRQYSAVTISPDGRMLAWIDPGEQGPALMGLPLPSGPAAAETIAAHCAGSTSAEPQMLFAGEELRGYALLHDNTHIFCLIDPHGDENTRAVLLDRRGSAAPRAVTPEGVQCRLYVHRHTHPHSVYIGLNDRDPQLHDLHILDTRSGSTRLHTENPGYDSWILDHAGQVRGGTRMLPDAGVETELRWDRSGQELARPLRWQSSPSEATGSAVVGIGSVDGSERLWMTACHGSDHTQLLECVLNGTQITDHRVLAAFPDCSIDDVWTDPATGAPTAVEYGRHTQHITAFDDSTAAVIDRMRAEPDGRHYIHIDRRSSDPQVPWALHRDNGRSSPQSGVWVPTAERIVWLPPQLPGVSQLPDVHTVAVDVPAADGVQLPCYLSVPAAETSTARPRTEPIPAVVLVHGGPWERDEAHFDPEVTALTTAGCAVIRVNFRGSAGFGTSFLHAGDREWGRAMSQDLDDAAAHFVRSGLIDPQRVAIMGASYGGYAALLAACRAQRSGHFAYCCAVASMAPTDLPGLIEGIPAYWEPLRAILTTRVGDPADPASRRDLEAVSPINCIGDLAVPLLLAHGEHDPRVPSSHIDLIGQALRDRGLTARILRFADEGHGLVRFSNRMRFYNAALDFLSEHLALEPLPARTAASDPAPCFDDHAKGAR